MRKIYFFVSLFIALFVFSPAVSAVTYCPSSAFGYGASATGGGNATPVLVSTVDQLKSALNKGHDKVIIITSNLTFTKMLTVQDGSNITLMALPGVKLTSLQQTASTSGILFVKRFNNLIIRNITFVGPGAYDCDGNDNLCFEDVTNAWVDHCDFQDGCDGNFDNKHKTDNITVSWCRFRYLKAPKPGGSGGSDDHRFTNLLGASSSDKPADGTYNFTWAYCWWDDGCKERMVRCRNAELHFINCYWNSSVANYYVGPENAICYFEGCTFAGKANSASKIFKSYGGTNACRFVNCTGNVPSNSGSVSAPAYSHDVFSDATAAVTAVTHSDCGAGATLLVTTSGAVSRTCDGGAAPITNCTVTWDAETNGGKTSATPSLVNFGSAIGSLPTAEKEGYTFDGWFTEPIDGTQINTETVVSSDVTFYAHFTETGSTPIDDCTKTFAFANTADVPAGVTNSTSTFYKFKTGGNSCTGSITIDGTTYSITKRGVNKSGDDFTITFTVPDDKVGTLYGLANSNGSTVRTLTLSNETGYSQEQQTSNSSSQANPITFTDMPAGDYTLETDGSACVPFLCLKLCDASSVFHTLSYDENGGSGTMADAQGINVTVVANAFTAPAGYDFKEWNSNASGSGTKYTVGQNVLLTEDLTLYAIWQAKTYTVTFNTQSGSGGTTSVTATFDETMPNIQIPTRVGYTFLGYFSEPNGAGTQYYDGNGNSVNSWDIASVTTLYAAWEETSSSSSSSLECNTHFWFFKASDAGANGETNDNSTFASMVGSSSSLSGTLTIDGVNYNVTGRTGDPAGDGIFGGFTIPADKTGVFYALAVSSGSGDRHINLVCGENTYELPVAGGSGSFKRIESEELPAGTYVIKRGDGGNVRLGVVAVKICGEDEDPNKKTIYLKASAQGNERFAVYCFGSGETWYDLTPVTDDCNGTIYKAEVDKKYTSYIFCRMDGATTENNWSNKWDQTVDLTAASGQYFTVNSWYDHCPCTASLAPFKVCVSGTWLRFAGEAITLNATCTGATHFQWYKGGTAEANKILGATKATYTKTCTIEDGGNYYCKAWNTAGQEVTSEPIGVRVPYLNIKTGRWGSDDDIQRIAMTRENEDAAMASGSLHLGVGWNYGFFISDGVENHGKNNDEGSDKLTSSNCTDWDKWIMNDLNNRCVMRTTKEGTYTFTIKFNKDDWTSIKVNVTYPPMVQTAGRPIYMEKTPAMAADGWNNIYYRIGKGNLEDGNDENWASAYQMTLVPGTARYYQTETPGWGNDFWAWHISNNVGDAGSKCSIYKTNSGDANKEITRSINFSGDEILDPGWTIYLKDATDWGHDNGKNNNCLFHNYTHTDGMLTHNISIGATEHGKIKVEWIEKDGTSQVSENDEARTISDLAHTCILKVTGVPDCGYDVQSLTIGGAAFTSGGNYILASDGINIKATFTMGTFNVNLHTNGGTITAGKDLTEYNYPDGASLPTIDDISRSGYQFGGWFDNPELSGSPVTEIVAGDCGNKEYWAKWTVWKPTPVFTWTVEDNMKAGGIYPVSVSSDGDANVTLTIVETITGVNGSFTAGNPATGTVALGFYPAATTYTLRATSPETTSHYAHSEDKTITIERCEKDYILSYNNSGNNPVNAGGSAKPRYYCETSGIGRIMKGRTGTSSISLSSGDFSGEAWATTYFASGDHSVQAYLTGVFKVILYVKSTSNNTQITALRYSDTYMENDGDGTDIKTTAQIIYNGDPSQTSLTKNAYETVTIVPPAPMSKDGWLYFNFSSSTQVWGAKLYRPEGTEPTTVAFSGETSIEKFAADAPFIKTAAQTTTPIMSGGTITYKSSDETVATVEANTGEVTPLSPGHAIITATLSGYGCFAQSTASYSLTVKKCTDPVCTITVTAGSENKCSAYNVTLTATAGTGASFQWYKDGGALSGETNPTLTTTANGDFYAIATANCAQKSNVITVTNLAAPTATKLYDYYYIKAGRVSPPIPLFQLTNVDTSDPSAFSMSHPAPAGCSYELHEDGIVYLVGTPATTLTAGTINLKVTAHNDCGFANATATLELRSLETTTKPQIAWVADGTKNQTLPGTVEAAKSTGHVLYQYLQTFFDLTPVNAYCTTDTNKLKAYYSQFDLILLTDYPDTQEVPSGDKDRKKSYSNALGCLIDDKPILSFEAFVAGCPNWGINTEPKTPNPKQNDMTLLCSAHNIFAGTHLSGGDKVDFLSSISGNGLQGFTGLEAPPGMLFIATIDNGSDEKLIVCCERQKVLEARMMIMGLNYKDMKNATDDGKLIIKQIINYLLNFTDPADCSIVFDDKNNTHVWSDPGNWAPAYNAVPKPEQAVRVDKPCNVDITNAHCSSIRLRKDAVNGCNGSLTILPQGGLTVMDYIKEVHGNNFMTTYPSAAGDLVIQASTTGQNGSLVFGNVEDDLRATVEYYSLASGAKTSSPVWQYIGIPITDRPQAIDAYHAAWMCSWESEGNVSSNWVWVENEDKIQPFKGYCITQQAAKKYTHIGSLSKPESKDLSLFYFTSPDGDGFNMFANSWVAPIDISKIESSDFGGAAEATIFIYNTGTRDQYNAGGAPSTAGTNTAAGQFNAIPVNSAPYMTGALTKIPTMQGFFIQATKAGTLTLDYKKICFDDKDFQTTAETMRAPKRRTEDSNVEKIVPEVMRLDVVSANWGDRLYILTHEEFSDAFDRGWDGSKQEGDAEAPMLALVRGNGLLAVAAIETAEERELSFRAGEDTEYTFHFNYEGETIYLYDRLADQAVEIKTGNTYSFTAENKTAAKRFIITKNPPRIPTGIENSEVSIQNSGAEKCIIDGVLYIIKNNRFYDARGVRVHSFKRKEVTP